LTGPHKGVSVPPTIIEDIARGPGIRNLWGYFRT
jgi:hypothetical protein